MMKASLFLPLAALVSLSSCDKIKEAAEKSADAAVDSVKQQVKDEIGEAIANNDLLKSGREYSEKAKAVVAQVDLNSLEQQVEDLKLAISTGDYIKAQRLGQSVDKFFGTEVVGNTMGLLKIQTEQGTEAAKGKLAEYLALPNLEPAQKQHLEQIGGYLANFDSQDRDAATKMLALAIASGCEAKFGHGGGGMALMVMNTLFPGTMGEPGIKTLPEQTPVEAE